MPRRSILDSIGNTPLVRLSRLPDPEGAEIYVKIEGTNPTGSMKDRMALSMIEGAERRGELKPGGRVVEYTGGSTGSALAMICAAKGYSAQFFASAAFSEDKPRTMRGFGATVEIIPSVDGKVTPEMIQEGLAKVAELAKEENTFWPRQFENPDNRAGYHAMAQEILTELGTVDVFVMGVGTGGCFSGNAEVLKAANPATRCVAIEPEQCRALSGVGPYLGHRLEGMGAGFVPAGCRTDLIDEIAAVSNEDAFAMARRLWKEEGIYCGPTAGSNVFTALRVARELGRGKRVVTVICDSGLKYLAGDLVGE